MRPLALLASLNSATSLAGSTTTSKLTNEGTAPVLAWPTTVTSVPPPGARPATGPVHRYSGAPGTPGNAGLSAQVNPLVAVMETLVSSLKVVSRLTAMTTRFGSESDAVGRSPTL